MASFYPLASKEELVKHFVGKSLNDIPTPAAILDVGKIKRNCNRILEAVDELKFRWRAHTKTHKTTELTRLQVGEGTGPANIIVSTIIEAENVAPLLLEYKAAGRAINVLYSFPPTPSSIPRLATLSGLLGPNGLSLIIDHPAQLAILIASPLPNPPLIFLKIDCGGSRAGVVPSSAACNSLLAALATLHAQKLVIFHGLYSHAGQSYSSSSRAVALDYLRQEFESLLVTSTTIPNTHPLILSVGATPTTTSIRNLLTPSTQLTDDESGAISVLKATITSIQDLGHSIEMHAGVYPTLDVQQLATHVLPDSMLQWDDLAITVMAEVASLYPGRGKNGTTEALISSGSIALGRETCKAYIGYGVLTPWNRPGVDVPAKGPEEMKGWIVGRISQEHGILTWSGTAGEEEKLVVGQRVRVWPNHACIAGAGFGWYLVVDGGDEIVDVWPRWRGW